MSREMSTATMTSEAKRALSKTIRQLRTRLIDDLRDATERAYRFSVPDARKAKLSEAARIKRARIEGWIAEQVRALPVKARAGARERLFEELIRDAAATLLQRLVYLRLLEASKLRPVPVVTGGWESRGYKDFREAAPELVKPAIPGKPEVRDDSEGYTTLLQLVFDELAIDLPGLFGPVRMTALVPVPASTLRAVITALDAEELASVWTDDTTLGWIYQYWNDPEREALDAKLAASKKLENHEIASKTQMFTERYMVEWLLHNSLGQMWLAMCKKHGWTADVARDDGSGSVLDRLEARRAEWRELRERGPENGGVALDALMPIEPGLEDRWKYWVPQPMPEDAVTQAPESVREIKLLDPACGSGHFLVIAFELLFHLYKEEARHRGVADQPQWSDRAIVESIVENNLHGIDIDPRAVQIAAAAVMLKARQLCADAEPRTMNLVAPALSLSSLPADDPARRTLYEAVERETGIPHELTARVLDALAGADHLGSLLRVDAEIDAAIKEYDDQLSSAVPTKDDQGSLFTGFRPRRRRRITAEQAKATLLTKLEDFLAQRSRGVDLGLRLRGEQLAAGVRFVRLVREGQYDLVVGNPPYQGTSKMADKAYVEKHYPHGKADLYAAFLERGLQLVRGGGYSALLTMRNWMFIKQYSDLRHSLLRTRDLRILCDLDRGAFDEVPNEVLATVMSVFRACEPGGERTIAMQPTPLGDKSYDRERTGRKRASVLVANGRYEFLPSTLSIVGTWPLIYWWSAEFLEAYDAAPKLGQSAPAKQGIATADNTRFLRAVWEVRPQKYERRFSGPDLEAPWQPFIKGADGIEWFEPLRWLVRWHANGLEIRTFERDGKPAAAIRNSELFFRPGVAFTMFGAEFSARIHRYPSVFDTMGSSIFPQDCAHALCCLNSKRTRYVMGCLNPTIHFQQGDVDRVPLFALPNAPSIFRVLEESFSRHESQREPSPEFVKPGDDTWEEVQAWARQAVDKDSHTPVLPPSSVPLPPAPTMHLSFAIGVALGRFYAHGGIAFSPPPSALPAGIAFLSEASDDDSLAHPAAGLALQVWAEHGSAIDQKRTLREYLREKFFSDVHRKIYENRPIYFPLSSSKKSFVAYVSIHRWTSSTLTDLLAEHLYPTKKRLEGEQADLRAIRDGADKHAARTAEKRLGQIADWLEELDDFIAKVEQCAEKGTPPVDAKTTPREVDARYEMDLDDGVMINSAALWPLLEPQWKDPKKWWKELANAEGKKDYDWSHLARRYFPSRVEAKCKLDPSLAVAHGCFWKYHPEKAYQWELRLQDEIRPDFTIDEPGSDEARAAFEAAHPDKVAELVAKEHQRRARKKAKAQSDEDDEADEPQGVLALDDGDGEAEELSA